MKKSIIIVLLCMMYNIYSNESKARICPLHHNQSVYNFLYTIKEGMYGRFILPWWLNAKRAKNAQSACNNCNFAVHSLKLYTYLTIMGESKKVALLKLYWENKIRADLEHFMTYNLTKLQLNCPKCLAYYGWHNVYRKA